jgi:hypothetical protein
MLKYLLLHLATHGSAVLHRNTSLATGLENCTVAKYRVHFKCAARHNVPFSQTWVCSTSRFELENPLQPIKIIMHQFCSVGHHTPVLVTLRNLMQPDTPDTWVLHLFDASLMSVYRYECHTPKHKTSGRLDRCWIFLYRVPARALNRIHPGTHVADSTSWLSSLV